MTSWLPEDNYLRDLCRQVSSPCYAVRDFAADLIGEERDTRAIPALIKALTMESRFLSPVEDALVRMGAPAVEPLVQAAKTWFMPQDAPKLRAVLSRNRDPASIPILLRMIEKIRTAKEPNSSVFSGSARSLSSMGAQEAIKPLLDKVFDNRVEGLLRDQAADALKDIGRHWCGHPSHLPMIVLATYQLGIDERRAVLSRMCALQYRYTTRNDILSYRLSNIESYCGQIVRDHQSDIYGQAAREMAEYLTLVRPITSRLSTVKGTSTLLRRPEGAGDRPHG